MEFLKVLWNNLRKGPVTDPFPFGETFTPDRYRGKVQIDPKRCVGCGTCRHVCAAGAININKLADDTGFEITVWRNTCCQCGQCRHYCPTHAITLSNDWHSAHRNTEKYTQITRARVQYDYCASCGAKLRFLPPDVLKRIYADHPEVNVDVISRLCPSCRRLDLAVEEDEACQIDAGGPIVDHRVNVAAPAKAAPPKASTPPAAETAVQAAPEAKEAAPEAKVVEAAPAEAKVVEAAPAEATVAEAVPEAKVVEREVAAPVAVPVAEAASVPPVLEAVAKPAEVLMEAVVEPAVEPVVEATVEAVVEAKPVAESPVTPADGGGKKAVKSVEAAVQQEAETFAPTKPAQAKAASAKAAPAKAASGKAKKAGVNRKAASKPQESTKAGNSAQTNAAPAQPFAKAKKS